MVFLIGYGNPGRADDGLGPAFAKRIEERDLPGVSVKTAFQLTVEHALDVAEADVVVFADADASGHKPFDFTELSSKTPGYLDSHNVSPSSVMSLAGHLFGAKTRGFLLGISGEEFGKMEERLSVAATDNLALAEEFFVAWLGHRPLGGEPDPAERDRSKARDHASGTDVCNATRPPVPERAKV